MHSEITRDYRAIKIRIDNLTLIDFKGEKTPIVE